LFKPQALNLPFRWSNHEINKPVDKQLGKSTKHSLVASRPMHSLESKEISLDQHKLRSTKSLCNAKAFSPVLPGQYNETEKIVVLSVLAAIPQTLAEVVPWHLVPHSCLHATFGIPETWEIGMLECSIESLAS
jgi:hypothetical protein